MRRDHFTRLLASAIVVKLVYVGMPTATYAQTGSADGTQIALETLSDGLKCPLQGGDKLGDKLWVIRSQFTGTKINLQVDSTTTLATRQVINTRQRAQFKNLDHAYLPSPQPSFGYPQVRFKCGQYSLCIHQVCLGGSCGFNDRNAAIGSVEVCDKETAEYVKAAIDALIELNKKSPSERK
jgi:hypothetical protein